MQFIEEYLENICQTKLDSFGNTDRIYFSIYKQTVKGIGLTDRQYSLVLSKIQEFHYVENLPCKIPLRTIDRSKYVKIVSQAEMSGDSVYESYKNDWLWIKIRFPFSKKLIVLIDSLSRYAGQTYSHKKGTHEHFFRLNPKHAVSIYNAFKEKDFDIDSQLITYANECNQIAKNTNDYIPYIENGNLLNANKVVSNLFEQTLFDKNNYTLKDKSKEFGYTYENTTGNLLVDKICNREKPSILIEPSIFTVNQIVESLHFLERWPLLVIVDDDKCYDQIYQIYRALNGVVDSNEQSVLFRVDSNDKSNVDLNAFIKDNKLNNWVDKNTKVVYINKTKLPKVLLKSNFRPKTAYFTSSLRANRYVSAWINYCCDLIIYHDSHMSNFMTYKGNYSWQVVN